MNSATNNTSTASAPAGNSYNAHHFEAFAYINDIRLVTPRGKGKPFVSVRLKCMQGERGENATHIYMNANVFGESLKTLLLEHEEASKKGSNTSVRGRVRVSDLELKTYVDKDGVTQPCCYGRLYAISTMYVGDTLVHSRAAAVQEASDDSGENRSDESSTPEAQAA